MIAIITLIIIAIIGWVYVLCTEKIREDCGPCLSRQEVSEDDQYYDIQERVDGLDRYIRNLEYRVKILEEKINDQREEQNAS